MVGLAKVFTGWSWGNKGTPDLSDNRFNGNEADRERDIALDRLGRLAGAGGWSRA